MRKSRHLLFLRDVLIFTFTAFGGPQAHVAMMLKEFVNKRRYVTEEELMELNALCQLLPGPSSTQTLVSIAYKYGGLSLAITTFFIWLLPAAAIMCFAALFFQMLEVKDKPMDFLKYVQPMAVGFVGYAAFNLSKKLFDGRFSLVLVVASAFTTVMFRSAYVFPLAIVAGAAASYFLRSHEAGEEDEKINFHLGWRKFWILVSVLLVAALLGGIINRTSPFSLPVRLFENFYRNGVLVFGGGQVLIPMMYTEFVEMKHYLTAQEFLSGLALQQAVPGPVFSFSSFIGGIAMKKYGYPGQMAGSAVATLGINLPGAILILFIIPFWDKLKKISLIKKSLWGINAVAVGFVVAAFVIMIKPVGLSYQSLSMILLTFLLLNYTKIPAPVIVLLGLGLGFVF